MPAARHTLDIDVSPAVLMAVITDFAAYPTFVTDMQSAEVRSHEGDADHDVWTVAFALHMIRKLTYTLRLERQGVERLRWSLVEGSFRTNEGGWTLEPLDGGTRTRATYEVDLDVGMFIPGSVMKTLVEHNLPRTLAAFKARAEARAVS
jgi:coenzyme Q-binding protein COQ10